MNTAHRFLTLLTDRFPPSASSGGHRLSLVDGKLSVSLFTDWVYTYDLDAEDLERSMERVFEDIVRMHENALAREGAPKRGN